MVADAQFARAARQHPRVHERGARAREVALAPARMRVVEQSRDGEIEHRVAEELEPLVAARAVELVRVRGMRERDVEQSGIGEVMAERLLELRARPRASARRSLTRTTPRSSRRRARRRRRRRPPPAPA